MFGIALLLALGGAEPAPSPSVMKILVLDLRADSTPPETARLLTSEITVHLARDRRLSVLSVEDLRSVISLEAEKKAMGCDEAACLAEIGSALGARYVVHGSIGKLGELTLLHLHLFDTQTQESIARETAEASTQSALLAETRHAIDRISRRITGDPEPAKSPSALTFLGGGAAVAGGAAVIGGALAAALSAPVVSDLDKAPVERQTAQTNGAIGTVVAIAGGAVLAAGGGLLAWELMQ
jgi:TolB-like protein